jgi:hypothetical protein
MNRYAYDDDGIPQYPVRMATPPDWATRGHAYAPERKLPEAPVAPVPVIRGWASLWIIMWANWIFPPRREGFTFVWGCLPVLFFIGLWFAAKFVLYFTGLVLIITAFLFTMLFDLATYYWRRKYDVHPKHA